MWGIALRQNAFVENEKTNLSELCEVGDVVWQRDVVSAGELESEFEKN